MVGDPGSEEPVAQADRLFVNLTERASRPRPAPSQPTLETAQEKAPASPELQPPVESGPAMLQLAEVLEMAHAALSAVNERLVSLERGLATGDDLNTELTERALEKLGRALRRSTSSSFPLDDDLKSKEDVEASSGWLPVLGLIPQLERMVEKPMNLSEATREDRRGVEAYRALRTNVLFLGVNRQVRSIQVTSPLRGEGKSTLAANLAVALAQTGIRVIALSADLRRPRLHRLFGLSNEKGLTTVLNRLAPLREVISQVPGIPTLKLVASGPPPTNPSELLLSPRVADIIRVLEDQCDVLLVDCSPVLPVTDAVAISQHVEATMVVVNAGMTNRRDLHRTVEALRQVNAPLLGTVVNGISSDHSGYGLGFGARYDYESEVSADRGRGSEDHAGADGRP